MQGEGNTIVYERDPKLRDHVFKTFLDVALTGIRHDVAQAILCCLPLVQVPEAMTYDKIFRVLIIQFMDAQNFDVRSVKKSCIHIVHPDGRIIPFDTFNLFYPRR